MDSNYYQLKVVLNRELLTVIIDHSPKRFILVKNYLMRIVFYLTAIALFSFAVYGQNIVDNPGFELYLPPLWNQVGTVDYYNGSGGPPSFEGTATAQSGNGFVGLRMYHMFGDYQEYIYQHMNAGEMQAGITYKITFYYTLSDASYQTTDDLGVAFLKDPNFFYKSPDEAEQAFRVALPQVKNAEGHWLDDAVNWNLFSGFYTATGNETDFAIGAFKMDETIHLHPVVTNAPEPRGSIVLYIDNVSISACAAFDHTDIEDIAFCEPGFKEADAYTFGATYLWSDGTTGPLAVIPSTDANYWVDITTSNGCVIRDNFTVRTFDTPQDLGADKMICSDSDLPVSLHISQKSGEAVLWSNGGLSGVNVFDNPGTYTVQKTLGDCFWADTITISSFDDVVLYPNPVSTSLSFMEKEGVLVNKIFSSNGELIWNETVEPSTLNGLISNLSPELYFIQFEGYGCNRQQKFEVIQK